MILWSEGFRRNNTNFYPTNIPSKNPSTMVGTRRSTEMKTPSQRVPSRKRYKHTPMVTPSEGNALGECVDQVSNDLLITCFSQMRPHIWYSVLPSNDGNTDISSGTRQRWDHMLPLLNHINQLQIKASNKWIRGFCNKMEWICKIDAWLIKITFCELQEEG